MRAAVTKMLERLDKNPQKFQKKLENLDINTVVIYGMGMHGQMLFALLKRLGIQVCNIIDVRKMMIEGIKDVLRYSRRPGGGPAGAWVLLTVS